MNRFLISILLILVLFSCKSTTSDKEEADFLILTIYRLKDMSKPLNILVSSKSNMISIYDSSITVRSPKGIPPSENQNFNSEIKKKDDFLIQNEVIKLTRQESNEIKNILASFNKEDFESQTEILDDGIGLRLNFFFSNDKSIDFQLVNTSTQKQQAFFKLIFKIIYSKTMQSDVLNKYYNKEFLD